jgi:hypothetical protein
MDHDKLLEVAIARHQATHAVRLTSWIQLGDGAWAIVTSEATSSGGKAMVNIKDIQTGRPNPIIAAGISAAQDRIDQALRSSYGAAWEDSWHESALLSLICDAGGELMLRCRAGSWLAKRIVSELENSSFRVRARIAAVSTEFPQLVAAVRALCRRPLCMAA